jgi:predicted amidophosphoribosyltransferase
MGFIFYYFLGFFQHCRLCQSPVFKRQTLCLSCLQLRFDEARRGDSEALWPDHWRQFPLLILGPYNNSNISKWIQGLKGPWQKGDFQQIAELWLELRIGRAPLDSRETWIIPAPSRSKNGRDHAFYLGQQLALKTGWNLVHHWAPQRETRAQKNLTKTQREAREWDWDGPPLPIHCRVIFVDDVLTTGSTAEGVWKALGRPDEYEIWCIAYQPRLAAPPDL